MGCYADVRHLQERFAFHPRNLKTVPFLRFHTRTDPLKRGTQSFLRVKTVNRSLDLCIHEKEDPPGLANFLLECGPSHACERSPPVRIRGAFQAQGFRQYRFRLDEDSSGL